MKNIFKNRIFWILLSVLITALIFFTMYQLLTTKTDEVENDCTVPSTACEEMDLLQSCPDDTVCREMLVGWHSADADCPTYKVLCFEIIE
ncbi:MAG: hypothetical protein WCY00_00030 [Candidatus Dojkabacteria bacterium]|jgi:hypothetical protein